MVNTLILIFINSFLFFKLIIYFFIKILLTSSKISKIIIIVMLTLGISISLNLNPHKKQGLDPAEIANKHINSLFKYAIKEKKAKVYNLIVIIITTSVIILCTFYIHILNKDHILKLQEQYFFIKNLIKTMDFFENTLNILLFILFIIIYFILIIHIINYLKFHILKRHLYLVGTFDQTTVYKNIIFEKIFLNIFLNRINLEYLINYIYKICYFQWCKKPLPANFYSLPFTEQLILKKQKPIDPFFFCNTYPYIENILFQLLTKWHYVLFILVFFYDLFYNNYQITLIFMILPWTLFYEFYLRFSNFIDSLWLYYDEIIHTILYCKQIELLDENTLKIDGDLYDFKHIKMIYNTYVLKGFKKDLNYNEEN